MQSIVRRFGLSLNATEFMMRCAVCNGRGYIQLGRDEAKARGCPPNVLQAVHNFFSCRMCGKLYWEGPKSASSLEHFKQLFESFS
mmetsp:Transcript_17982/g.50109  ORF Transcript_17982/g.50109 Transcript_17982/m.50109 type:complete len:85 (+) Transcript_17982:4437-4691(+)